MVWIGAILAIGALIIVHEAGHYVVARWCKMRVDKFSVGFGPGIWGWKRGDTQFQIAPIPFGGYVAIHGMLIAEDVDPDDVHAYPNRPAWQRFLTIFAGPATNYLFAIFLALILYVFAGVPTGTSWYQVRGTQAGYDAVGKLEAGDRIVQLNGEDLYYRYPGKRLPELTELVQKDEDKRFVVTVLRDGKEIDFEITAKVDLEHKKKHGEEVYRLGMVYRPELEREREGVFSTVGHAFWYPVEQTRMIAVGLYKVIRGEEKGALTGPVGITSIIGGAIKAGWISALELLMILNVYLGLFNLFPLPALDGGRLVFLSYEMATRRRANPKVEATVHMVGIMALLVLMVLVTYKDIARLL
jgi:regulator of sigma E protease